MVEFQIHQVVSHDTDVLRKLCTQRQLLFSRHRAKVGLVGEGTIHEGWETKKDFIFGQVGGKQCENRDTYWELVGDIVRCEIQ